ncbi:hypothetical protein PHLCEN_2v7085 [Hermanssonia centrifuga]|uniref:AB hydrolase-1 domain-containing protein n=1 Tax=Hermanssonia centrifuga TaxID=98765 RepID=A0A2R6NXG5_9APHY|nr:hypothetical protein PHLCEN_2v7085 [Hermanssonia centrifuga]
MAAPVFPTLVKPSMETLPESSPLRQMFPETFYSNGNYYSSPFGRVKYWILGPADGKKIVLIHGISTPSFGFKNVAPELVKNGFQVLLYDLYARGYSEAPQVSYDPNLYITQLALLLQYIHWSNVNVVGMSMGGAVAAAFSAMFPHLVDEGVVFLAAAGMMVLPKPKQIQNQDPVAALNAQSTIDVTNQIRDLQTANLPGYQEAITSSLKGGIITGVHWAYETLGKTTDKRFLIFHGTADPTVPYGEALKIKELIPQAELVSITGAGHALVIEEGVWEDMTKKIITFFA